MRVAHASFAISPAAALALVAFAAFAAPPFDHESSSVYQWSVTSAPPDKDRMPGRAFLWIPERCAHLRGVVVGQQNMLEEPIFECPAFREELAKADLGIVFIAPKQCGIWLFDDERSEWLKDILARLGEASGYGEMSSVPVAPIGHSALAMWPYFMSERWHARMFAGVSLKGAWADMSKSWGAPAVGKGLSGVPFLLLDGEYEDAENRARLTRAFCNAYPDVPFSFCGEMGAGHFDWSDELARYLGIYFRKAAHARIKKRGAPLERVDPSRTGWLMERWRRRAAPSAKPAPVSAYKGDRAEAYWYFDREMAYETAILQERFRAQGKTPLVGYRFEGKELPQRPKEHLQVFIPFKPVNGMEFAFEPMFTEDVLEGRLSDWTGLPPGAKAPHPDDARLLFVQRICGPCARIAPNRYEIRFNRGSGMKLNEGEICFQAVFPGDGTYRRAVQQSRLRFSQPRKPSGIRRYYVREGAATVDAVTGGVTYLALPPRAKRPHVVTVVEWEWGADKPVVHEHAHPAPRR